MLQRFKNDSFAIFELIEKLQNGKIVLPKIQRGYVWQPYKIPYLLDSIYQGFPINTIILWKVSQRLKEDNIVRGGSNRSNIEYLLLDGQQRLISLALAFLGKKENVIMTGGKKKNLERTILFNLEQKEGYSSLELEDASEESEIDNNLFALNSNGIGKYWINSLEKIYQKKASLEIINAYNPNLITKNQLKFSEYHDKLEKVRRMLEFKIPAIVLNEEISYEEATEIFKRINSTGSHLSGTDLALALLTLKWNECSDEFDELLKENLGDWGIDYLMIIRQLAIISTGQCKYEKFEKLEGETIKQAFLRLKDIYNKIYDIARGNFDIENISLLPSKYPFYLLCFLQQEFPNEFAKSKILKKWFFSFNAFSIYSGSSETKLQEHINYAKSLKEKGHSLDQVLKLLIEKTNIIKIDTKFLEENNKTTNSIFKILYFVQRDKKCGDFLNNNIKLTYSNNFKGYNKEVHHIFPKNLLKDIEESKINDIANLTFISAETNKKIKNKKPIDYFNEYDLIEKEKMEGHFIPIDNTELLKVENYEQFLEKRRVLMINAINDFLF